MNDVNWTKTACFFARQMARYRLMLDRGAVCLSFFDETTGKDVVPETGPVVIGVFENDNIMAGRTDLEIELLRHRLDHLGATELGFGVSEDGTTWALLIAAADQNNYQTEIGKRLQLELITSSLDEMIWDSWQQSHALATVLSRKGDFFELAPEEDSGSVEDTKQLMRDEEE